MFISHSKKDHKTCLKICIILFWIAGPPKTVSASLSSLISKHSLHLLLVSLPSLNLDSTSASLTTGYSFIPLYIWTQVSHGLFWFYLVCLVDTVTFIKPKANSTYHVNPSLTTVPPLSSKDSSGPTPIPTPHFIHNPSSHNHVWWIDIYISIFPENLQTNLEYLFLNKVFGIHFILNNLFLFLWSILLCEKSYRIGLGQVEVDKNGKKPGSHSHILGPSSRM